MATLATLYEIKNKEGEIINMDVNSVVISGRITKELEISQTKNGTKVCNFSLAINNGRDKEADYIDCTLYGTAICESLDRFATKGTGLIVQERIKTDKYQVDGQNRISTFVLVNNFRVMDRWKTNAAQNGTENEDGSYPEENMSYPYYEGGTI